MLREGDLLKQVELAYRRGLVRSHRDHINVHLSELQQMNLELLRKDLVGHAFNARYKIDKYNHHKASSDVRKYSNIPRHSMPQGVLGRRA